MRARVIVLAGPSGAGKSRLAERLGWPVLRLDDFYKDGSDATLPRIGHGANAGLIDWDHPASWLPEDAVAAVETLCREGVAQVPVYEIVLDGRSGWQSVELGDASYFLAEGIFAQEIVPALRERGLLQAAYCVRQHPTITFWRRLVRDLREHRKPPLMLLRRGLDLMREQQDLVRRAEALGCRAATPDEAYADVSALSADPGRDIGPWAAQVLRSRPRQPDQRSCGAACLVVERAVRDERYAELLVTGTHPTTGFRRDGSPAERFRAEVLDMHRRITGAISLSGRWQVPWSRQLGTPPWAVSGQIGRREVRSFLGRPRATLEQVSAAVAAGVPVPLYVGTSLMPRHVVLALDVDDRSPDLDLWCYDPATGRVRVVAAGEVLSARMDAVGWPRAWFAVLPRDLASAITPPTRRTPA